MLPPMRQRQVIRRNRNSSKLQFNALAILHTVAHDGNLRPVSNPDTLTELVWPIAVASCDCVMPTDSRISRRRIPNSSGFTCSFVGRFSYDAGRLTPSGHSARSEAGMSGGILPQPIH